MTGAIAVRMVSITLLRTLRSDRDAEGLGPRFHTLGDGFAPFGDVTRQFHRQRTQAIRDRIARWLDTFGEIARCHDQAMPRLRDDEVGGGEIFLRAIVE